MRNVLDQSSRENQNTFLFRNSLPKIWQFMR